MEPGGLAAVKVIDKAELCKEEDKMFLVDKEIEIMSQLDHPHIVRLYEVYENEAEVRKVDGFLASQIILGLPCDGAGQGWRVV